MRKTIIRSALAAAVVGISAPLSAHAATYGLGIQAGTLGIGPDLNVGVNKYVSFDLGLNTFSHSYSSTESGIEYDFKAKLNTVHLLANVYPFGGIFHVTAGVVSNGNKFDMSGKPTGGSYTINNTTYSASQVGTLDGKLTFPDTAGYVGVGWGLSYDPQSHWGFNFDLGALYQGKPKFALTSTGGTLSSNPTLQQNLSAEQQSTQDSLNKYKWYPVARFGIYLKF